MSEYILENTQQYNDLRVLGLALGAVVIVAALGIALIRKLRPW